VSSWPCVLMALCPQCPHGLVSSCPCVLVSECFCEGGEDKRIPLLSDVFDAFPNTPVNIDIKVDDDTLIKKVCVRIRVSLRNSCCVTDVA